MVTPDYLNKVVEATKHKSIELNNYLTQRMAKRIADAFSYYGEGNGLIIPASINDLHKLMRLGTVAEDVRKEMERIMKSDGLDKEVRQAFINSGAEIAATNHNFAVRLATNLGGIDVPDMELSKEPSLKELQFTQQELQHLESAYRRTNGVLKNLTNTTAINAESDFIMACDSAYWKAKHGVSIGTAVVEAIKEVSSKGITVAEYAGGRKTRIESAIARAVRTGINQANADIILSRNSEMGINYVSVSQHFGARVTNTNDYKDHSWWQGQVYKVSWSTPVMSQHFSRTASALPGFEYLDHIREAVESRGEFDYPDFESTCGYGDILGICGINCRHTFSGFYPGINEEPTQLYDKEENEERYKKEQKARAMEREIRSTKRQRDSIKASGLEIPEAKDEYRALSAKMSAQSSAYSKFMQDNGLSQANWRTAVPQPVVINQSDFMEKGLRTIKNNNFAVDWTTVKSKEYTERFKTVSDNTKANELAAKRARNALKNRDGKKTEELYAISLTSGKDVAKITDQHHDFGVNRTAKFNADVARAEKQGNKLLLIHNHPNNTPPSPADINELLNQKDAIGMTVGHKGSIYLYTKPTGKIEKIDYSVAMRKIKGYNSYNERYFAAMKLLAEKFGFEIWEV